MITQQDLEFITTNASVEAKSIVAVKVADYYQDENISIKAKTLAEQIFKIIVKDVESKVRNALATSLHNSKELPKDVVSALIKDVDSIAIPFISNYQHLSYEDTVDILSTQNIDKHVAVALRKNLSYEISDYIVHNCHSRVVEALVVNKDAKILNETFEAIIQKYSDDEKIQSSLIERQELPVPVIEKLITFLSQELLGKLVKMHKLPDNMASDVIEDIKEKSILKISEDLSTDEQIEGLAIELYKNNRLTPSLIVRAICMGDIKFFEYGISILSQTSVLEVRKTMADTKQDFMIRNLLRKAYIPKTMFTPIFSALEVIKEVNTGNDKNQNKEFSQKVIERILTISMAGDGLTPEDVKYLISRIG